MHTQLNYQGLESSPWMDEFMNARVSKLGRYLSPSANIHVHLRLTNQNVYETSLTVHNLRHDYAFKSEGQNLYESFTASMQKAVRVLSEEKKKLQDRIHRKFSTPEERDTTSS